ncbi:uncharacterized protein C8Q71DRAFT_143536 [Rhodofomes roseus]|uniref:Uncharacterized protein n=1 Tax=Rhodofomes roseus TaxID=34475 RepID=A0ABQ8KAE1_9APHY|nr:uncharacterized protein C8Q71DRAFT_143536 [Rhodofomes roseus]KAH9834471.1 hypothetical protein C8Q71DRAFT_143536 [Rhodofomes roseus]
MPFGGQQTPRDAQQLLRNTRRARHRFLSLFSPIGLSPRRCAPQCTTSAAIVIYSHVFFIVSDARTGISRKSTYIYPRWSLMLGPSSYSLYEVSYVMTSDSVVCYSRPRVRKKEVRIGRRTSWKASVTYSRALDLVPAAMTALFSTGCKALHLGLLARPVGSLPAGIPLEPRARA